MLRCVAQTFYFFKEMFLYAWISGLSSFWYSFTAEHSSKYMSEVCSLWQKLICLNCSVCESVCKKLEDNNKNKRRSKLICLEKSRLIHIYLYLGHIQQFTDSMCLVIMFKKITIGWYIIIRCFNLSNLSAASKIQHQSGYSCHPQCPKRSGTTLLQAWSSHDFRVLPSNTLN